MPDNRWATLREAAEYYSVTDRTIRNWIADGRVAAVRVGPKLIRVDITSLENAQRPLQIA